MYQNPPKTPPEYILLPTLLRPKLDLRNKPRILSPLHQSPPNPLLPRRQLPHFDNTPSTHLFQIRRTVRAPTNIRSFLRCAGRSKLLGRPESVLLPGDKTAYRELAWEGPRFGVCGGDFLVR